LPAESVVETVTDTQYVPIAQKLIKEARTSIRVMMSEMGYYECRPTTPSNLLIKELIEAMKRGVKVEVILEVREDADRTSKRNRHSGKILSDGGVDVVFDSPKKTTHAKLMIVDAQTTLLGSTNWTYYALTNNHEVSLMIRSKEVAKELTNYFNQVEAVVNGRKVFCQMAMGKLGYTGASVARFLGMMTSSVNRIARLKEIKELDVWDK
jgi:phosphatidylserine/phosphatidylglycerophosphate/cardiolipin synthase-like enzyme